MKTLRFWIISLVLATTLSAAPTSSPSDDQQIRDTAAALMDPAAPFDPADLQLLVTRSDLEQRFATEMLKAMRAEHRMFRRAAVAVSGGDNTDQVRRVERTAAETRDAIRRATPVITGDAATLPFAPGGGPGTTLHFQKLDTRWKLDLIRRYRERSQVTEQGMAKWKARQRAAEEVARMYEKKEERDLDVIPLLYETMSAQLAEPPPPANRR